MCDDVSVSVPRVLFFVLFVSQCGILGMQPNTDITGLCNFRVPGGQIQARGLSRVLINNLYATLMVNVFEVFTRCQFRL